MSRNQSVALAAVVAIVAIAAGMLLARTIFSDSGSQQPGLVRATVLTPARPLPEFELIDQDSASFTPKRLKDHWSLLFFGFASCPDVCPTTLAMLAQVEKSLADLPAQQRPQIVLVSVDPKRDTPDQLAAYVKFFSPSFTGVTGTPAAIDDFTRALGVPVAISPNDNGGYTVDHSAAIFLIDPSGSMRALLSTPHAADVIAADYRRIVAAG
jgi:protein SCO1